MAEQDYDAQEEESDSSGEVIDAAREAELDDDTLRSNEQRSRFFFAAMSFLIALLFLSAYLNHLTSLNGTILQVGVLIFAVMGVFLLLRGGSTGYKSSLTPIEQSALTPFELLVQEALAAIPEEFQGRMDNVFVQVQYEPAQDVLRRVGSKEGYTLLGLYEGVPLTAYGRGYSAHPETITIYQRTIERYCHGDPDRIREQVLHTVLHEVAHHFGIDHDEMPIWIK